MRILLVGRGTNYTEIPKTGITSIIFKDFNLETISYLPDLSNSIDCLLLDLILVNNDFLLLSSFIKEWNRISHGPVFFMTSNLLSIDYHKLSALGVNDFLNSPLQIDELKLRMDLFKSSSVSNIINQQNYYSPNNHEKIVAEISYSFLNLDDFDKKVNHALEIIGKDVGASRVYIFEDDITGDYLSNSFEWCIDETLKQKEELQNISYDSIPSWKKLAEEQRELNCSDIKTLPEDLFQILEQQSIKSIFILPFKVQKKRFGSFGFDDCLQHRVWTQSEIHFFKTIVWILATVFERRKVDEQGKRNHTLHQRAQSTAHLAHWTIGMHNARLEWSDEMYRIFGQDSDRFAPGVESVIDLIHPEDRDSLLNIADLAWSKKKSFNTEYRIIRPNGEIRYIKDKAELKYNSKGELESAFGTTLDITAQKLFEISIEQTKRDLQVIFDNSPAIMMLLNSKTEILKINKTGLDFIDKENEYIINKKCGDFFSCITIFENPNTCGTWDICKSCEVRNTIESTILDKENRIKLEAEIKVNRCETLESMHVLISSIVLEEAGDGLFLIVIDDITDNKKIEFSLKKSNKLLKDADIQKNQFISILSHDIRSRIAEMSNAVSLIQAFVNEPENKEELILASELLQRGLLKTLDLLEDLLEWGRVITRKGIVNLKEVQVADILMLFEDNLEFSLTKKNLNLQIECPEELKVLGDENMIRTVFRNLISNAIKFSNINGLISVKCGLEFNNISDLNFPSSKLENMEVFRIEDKGVGMEESMYTDLFDLSKVISTEGTAGEKGTGLGLSVCKELVEKQSGYIWVESKIGEGSMFYFALPKVANQED